MLVERDVEAWYKSWYDVQITNYDSWPFRILAAIDPLFIGKLWAVATDCCLKGYVGGRNKKEIEEKSRGVYQAHNQAVKEKVPEGQLLVYRLGSGWGSLCEFLGKPVPDVPFPCVNEKELATQYVQALLAMGLRDVIRRWAWYVLPIGTVLVAWWLSR